MPYSIIHHADQLIWVALDGHLTLPQADNYLGEIWALLDGSCPPTDLLVDGRRFTGAAPGARRRSDQVAHHPNLGHLAFVVGELHMLMFAPLVKLVSGIGLFGDDREALAYLREARGLPPVADLALPNLPPPPAVDHDAPPFTPHEQRALGGQPQLSRLLPPRPASRLKRTPIYQRDRAVSIDGQRAGAGDGESE